MHNSEERQGSYWGQKGQCDLALPRTAQTPKVRQQEGNCTFLLGKAGEAAWSSRE